MTTHGCKLWVGDIGVDPTITSKADVAGQCKVETGIPVDQHKDVDHELGDAERVGVGRSRLHAIQGLVESWHTKKAVDPHQGSLDAEDKVEEVSGQQGCQVPQETFRVQVALLQLSQILDQDALIQVTWRGKNKV